MTGIIVFILFLLPVSINAFACTAYGSEKGFTDKGETKVAEEFKPVQQLVTTKPIIRITENDTAVFNVKCWQNGQLILEENNWVSPQLSTHFITLRKSGASSPGIYLIDFQHTFCTLKQR